MVAKCGTVCTRKAGGRRCSAPGRELDGLGMSPKMSMSKDMQVRAVVQRSTFDHCGAPGYNIAAGRCGLRLYTAS
jgi:hypothetical protein